LTRLKRIAVASLLLAGLTATTGAEELTPRDVLNKAKAEAGAIPKQAEALARLAWPADGASDPLVQAAARLELVGFGSYALPALRKAVKEGDAEPGDTFELFWAVRNDGRTDRFQCTPSIEDLDLGNCIEAALDTFRYPKYRGERRTVPVPLRVR